MRWQKKKLKVIIFQNISGPIELVYVHLSPLKYPFYIFILYFDLSSTFLFVIYARYIMI